MRRIYAIAFVCLMVLGLALNAPAQTDFRGNITTSSTDCSIGAACVEVILQPSDGALSVTVTGTYSGTLQFEVSTPPNVAGTRTWVSINGDPLPSGAAVTSTTSTGTWRFTVAGFERFRVRASALASGTANLAGSGRAATARSNTFSTVPTFPAQVANTLFSGPASGADATPTFRAQVLADLPEGTANQYLKTNAGATSLEHVTLSVGTSGTDFAIAHGAGTTTLNLPSASATNRGALLSADWTTFNGKANASLNNLASVAINLPLLPDVAAADDFGSATLPFKDIFFAGSSGTPGTNNFRLTGASTSGTRVITAADGASVTVIADAGAANNFLTAIATTGAISKAQPAAANLSDGTTGTGLVVLGTTPTFTTNITAPLVIGGTGAASTLSLRSTSGTGGAGADIIFQTGTNGGTEAARFLNSGYLGIATAVPQSLLDVQGPTGTGAATAGILTLATKELTIVDGDQLGRINFNAPLESAGSDAILPGAALWAEADATFSATVNTTDLVFGTATTSTPVERLRIKSGGKVTLPDASALGWGANDDHNRIVGTTAGRVAVLSHLGVTVVLDTNADSADQTFEIRNDTTDPATATLDFAVRETGLISTYGQISTVSKGVPAEYATVDLTAQGAAIAATTLYAVPAAPGNGMYRVCYVAKVTTADGVSSILGGANGFQVIYTDQDDSVVTTTAAGPTSNLDTTQAQVNGCIIANAKASTNIQYSFGYTSDGGAGMAYNLHIKLEAL